MDEHRKILIRRLKRTTLSIYDLESAEAFAEEILAGESSSNKPEIVREALDLALRVSYSRPFTGNRTGENDDFAPRLTSECLSLYSLAEKNLHKEVFDSRNQTYAHSDPGPYNLEVSVAGEGGVISGYSHDPGRPLSLSKVAQLLEMSRKLQDCLKHERHHIGNELGNGEY